MKLQRLIRHLFVPPWWWRRAFPRESLSAIEAAVRESERRHHGEIRVAIEASLDWLPLLRGATARTRAVQVFSNLRVWDTEQNNGVLIYLLLADRHVEILADRGLHARVGQAEWERLCREMIAAFHRGEFEQGIVNGVHAVGRHLAQQFPATGANVNELPDRPTLL
jgi:uncharacterized membrane protein YgcG